MAGNVATSGVSTICRAKIVKLVSLTAFSLVVLSGWNVSIRQKLMEQAVPKMGRISSVSSQIARQKRSKILSPKTKHSPRTTTKKGMLVGSAAVDEDSSYLQSVGGSKKRLLERLINFWKGPN